MKGLQPQAKDAEIAILGAILIESNAIDKVTDLLTPDSFYVSAHQKIFTSILNLQKKHQPIDLVTVTEELKQAGHLDEIGGPYELVKLTNAIVSSANIVNHARLVHEKYTLRKLISISSEITAKALDPESDCFELIDLAEKQIMTLSNNNTADTLHISSVLINTLNKIDKWKAVGTSITGIKSGFSDLDNATRGWQPGDLIIVAARPSVGKTAFALNLVRNAALSGAGVGIWSLEMKAPYLALRMLAAQSDIILNKLQTGSLTDVEYKKLAESANSLSRYNIFFDDANAVNLRSLKAKARRLKKKHDIGLIVIDYLQLMHGESKNNREQEIATISRELKNLAQELEIPIVALSQLSREGVKNSSWDVPPPISSLRESGAIEQDADLILMLWGANDAELSNDKSYEGKRRIRIMKQRNGTLMTCEMDFRNEIQLFKSIADIQRDEITF
ncbi:MAG: replicative DNA helicase [Planctomycetota bacterium]|jgi:replicative DNA helicase